MLFYGKEKGGKYKMINENLVKKYMNICLEFINETICDMTKIRKEF